jgi:hypothetical protein
MKEGVGAFAEPMSDDDYCINDKGIQVAPGDIDEAAFQRMAIDDDDDPVVAPILCADEVLELLRACDRLNCGMLIRTVHGGLEAFLRLPGGYRDVPDLIRGLGPVAQ